MDYSSYDMRVRGRLIRFVIPAAAFFVIAAVTRGAVQDIYSRLQILAFCGLAAAFEFAPLPAGGKRSLLGWCANSGAAALAILIVKFSIEGLPS